MRIHGRRLRQGVESNEARCWTLYPVIRTRVVSKEAVHRAKGRQGARPVTPPRPYSLALQLP